MLEFSSVVLTAPSPYCTTTMNINNNNIQIITLETVETIHSQMFFVLMCTLLLSSSSLNCSNNSAGILF